MEVVEADFCAKAAVWTGRTFDCVFLSHILHDFDAAKCLRDRGDAQHDWCGQVESL